MEFNLFPIGDHAILLEFGTVIDPVIHQQVQEVATFLDLYSPSWMIEYIPAFTTLTIIYRPTEILYKEVCIEVTELLANIPPLHKCNQRVVEIPVCYGGEFGPDLEFVAAINQLTTEEVIHLHSTGDYIVYMIGFSPGFPYIGGMSEKIAAPRKKTPRLKIPACSVGIAGKQTGIYPMETPGGWQIIGQTPLSLFRINEDDPSLLKAGDRIKFTPISKQELIKWEK